MNNREKLIKSEIVEMFDTTKEALRHYENVGLIHPEKDEKKYRYYGFDEMAKLRQLFILKDLGFQLVEMKLIMDKEISQEEFAQLLTTHNDLLKRKIERYEEIQNNIDMVLKLLKDEQFKITFSLKEFKKRVFLLLDSKEVLEDTPKGYYERFKSIIHEEYYNERVLVSSFDFDMLDSFESGASKLCFDIGDLSPNSLVNEDIITKEYCAGKYLSVFYVFKHGNNSSLGEIKQKIEDYILRNDLTLEDETVLEFEHPELGMLLDTDEDLYEIQMKVRYKNG